MQEEEPRLLSFHFWNQRGRAVDVFAKSSAGGVVDLMYATDVYAALVKSVNLDVPTTRVFRPSSTIRRCIVIVVNNQTAYMATATAEFPCRVALAFVQAATKLMATHSAARPHVLTKHIRDAMEWYSSKDADVIRSIRSDADETKDILHDCIERLLQRSELLENMEQKTQNLQDQAARMVRLSDRLSWKEYWKAKRCAILGGAAAVIVVGASIAAAATSLA